ncbi:MAG: hypothetical protein WD737_12240 [Gemmatimonadota bacterium]
MKADSVPAPAGLQLKATSRKGMLVVTIALGSALWSETSAAQISAAPTSEAVIAIETPLVVPAWALAQRELLRVNGEGVQLYADAFLNERGFLPMTPTWGVGDGPDDFTENIRNWPLAHALGGPEPIIEAWELAWEGHLQQVGQTRIPQLEMAEDGIFRKEFMTSYDWEHISEGLGPFYYYGLSRPNDPLYEERMRRFAGFYMNEDPAAPNYDPEQRIIRSLFNGSLGPKLTPATVDDWDGIVGADVDPNSSRRTRFVDSGNIVGDHPLNLNITMLHLHAYMLTQDEKYRDWVLEYVDAWRERIDVSGGNIPSNIGLDGTIGGEWDGNWYSGVFGWNSPDGGERNYTLRGPPEAFGAALLLTGDQAYTAVLRRQFDNLFEASRVEDGRLMLPRYYDDEGWYGYGPIGGDPSGAIGNHVNVLLDIYMWSQRPEDRERLPRPEEAQMRHHPDLRWLDYLDGALPDYPLIALQEALGEVRQTAQRLRASGNLTANPVSTTALLNLTMGASDPGGSTHGPLPVHAQVRHFDPARQRAGLPEDVAALVERVGPQSVTLTLVNVSPFDERLVTVQMGAYGEHHARSVTVGDQAVPVDARDFDVHLAPGAGATLTIDFQRYAHQPTLDFPWDRSPE